MFKFIQFILHKTFNIVHRISLTSQSLFVALAQYIQQCCIITCIHILRSLIFLVAKIQSFLETCKEKKKILSFLTPLPSSGR